MRKEKLIALAAACVMAAGIVGTEAQPSASVQLNFGNPGTPFAPNTMLVAPTMPPPLWNQPVPMAPGPGLVYVPGNWAWNGSAWVWVPGTWTQPPFPRARWSPGHWDRDRRGPRGSSRWVNGRWR